MKLAAEALFGLSVFLGVALAATALFSRRATRCLDRRPALAALVVALIAAGVAAGLGFIHLPMPQMHDEYSHLFAADTFAHGRLSNPTPPLPEHFESMHVLATPSYASKYPPGQGLSLALGQVLFGLPIAGAWLVFAAACAAIHWGLRATLPRRFALAGALLIAIHPSIHGDKDHSWTETFWGGQVALLGGALLFGAAARLARRARPVDGLALGAGLGILALSRPMEGLIAAAFALIGPIRAGVDWRTIARRVAPPAAILVLAALSFQALLNFRVAGSALRMPYAAYESRYATIPPFLWMPQMSGKTYGNDAMKEFYLKYDIDVWQRQRSFTGFRTSMRDRIHSNFAYFVLPFAIAAFGLPLALRRHRARHLAFLLALAFLWSLQVSWNFPHYLAVFVPLGAELVARSLRDLALLERRWLGGIAVAGLMGWICWSHLEAGQRAARPGWPLARPMLEQQLEQSGGKHLVIVDRKASWSVHREWVYNRADLGNAPVVWARSLDEKRDRELIQQFPGRTSWRLVQAADGALLDKWPK